MSYKSIFEQTADWMTERLGKFTSSEIHKLMTKGRAKDQFFGDTAETYIKSKLAEIITQEPCVNLDGLNAIEHGNSYELEAITAYENVIKRKVDYFGKANPRFFPYSKMPEWAGGSPDGIDGKKVVEVKAPFNSLHHVNHLLIGDAEGLKKEKPMYYGQIQFNMICTGLKEGVFISYDPRTINPNYRLHTIEIPFDQAYCDELEIRIAEAVKLLKVFKECISPSVMVAEFDESVNATIIQ